MRYGLFLGQVPMAPIGAEPAEPVPAPEPEPIPAPEPVPIEIEPPPPEPECVKFGRPVQDNGTCSQFFKCTDPDGNVTYKREPVKCPSRRVLIYYGYPYPYYFSPPIYPEIEYEQPCPPGVSEEECQAFLLQTPEETTLKRLAPVGIAAAVIGAYLLLK